MKLNRLIYRRLMKNTTNKQKRDIIIQLINTNENMNDNEKETCLKNLSKIKDEEMSETLDKIIKNMEVDNKCGT